MTHTTVCCAAHHLAHATSSALSVHSSDPSDSQATRRGPRMSQLEALTEEVSLHTVYERAGCCLLPSRPRSCAQHAGDSRVIVTRLSEPVSLLVRAARGVQCQSSLPGALVTELWRADLRAPLRQLPVPGGARAADSDAAVAGGPGRAHLPCCVRQPQEGAGRWSASGAAGCHHLGCASAVRRARLHRERSM